MIAVLAENGRPNMAPSLAGRTWPADQQGRAAQGPLDGRTGQLLIACVQLVINLLIWQGGREERRRQRANQTTAAVRLEHVHSLYGRLATAFADRPCSS